jgi:hypothetical protein
MRSTVVARSSATRGKDLGAVPRLAGYWLALGALAAAAEAPPCARGDRGERPVALACKRPLNARLDTSVGLSVFHSFFLSLGKRPVAA